MTNKLTYQNYHMNNSMNNNTDLGKYDSKIREADNR